MTEVQMEVSIYSFSEKGKRENNEDYLFADALRGLFIVCDGVGGSNSGEVASEIVATTIGAHFQDAPEEDDASVISVALKQAQTRLADHSVKHDTDSGMATTLALLKLNETTATVAHIGDSRVYHVRNGIILYHTRDHSLVNELLTSGYITQEEAINHPKRNVITRAVQAREMEEADVTFIDDVQTGDYFLVCSDGILEAIDNKFIQAQFLQDNNFEATVEHIQALCRERSRDNYSAIFIKILQPLPDQKQSADDDEVIHIKMSKKITRSFLEIGGSLLLSALAIKELLTNKWNIPWIAVLLLGVLTLTVQLLKVAGKGIHVHIQKIGSVYQISHSTSDYHVMISHGGEQAEM